MDAEKEERRVGLCKDEDVAAGETDFEHDEHV
jgi:hypothetical protein